MKVGFLITARLKSTRLPKKLLLNIKGKSMIEHMIERLKTAKSINEIIICTSTNDQDQPLIDIAHQNNINAFAGDPDDVLKRLLDAAKFYKLDYVLNITADCPLVDPNYADEIVKAYKRTNSDLIRQFDLPHGVFSYGIKIAALEKIVAIKDSTDTEVWGRYFVDTGLFNVLDLEVINKKHFRPGLRMTVDYPNDFKFIEAIFEELYDGKGVFSLDQILDFLDNNPQVIDINKDCGQQFSKRYISQSEPSLKKNFKVSSALIIGSGSIGQRHIRNLNHIGIKSVYAYRSKKGHYKDLPQDIDVEEIYDWYEVLKIRPDIVVISNPSSLHIDMAMKVSSFAKGVFIEKPISNSLEGCDQLSRTLLDKKITPFVGFNLMFHPLIKKLINFYNDNDLGRVINFQCQVGQWLPDWHPYENFKEAYYARKDLGGGVALTLIHEVQLAIELCGKSISVYGEISDYDKLPIQNVDVCSDMMIKHQYGAISQIHLDYIQKPSHRSGLITFERGWMSYDFNTMELKVQSDDAVRVIYSDPSYDLNNAYIDQMKTFINYVEEGRLKHSYDIFSGIESLKVIDAFFKSSKKCIRVKIPHNERFSF